jgi:isoleucyl-tRNA synthetase
MVFSLRKKVNIRVRQPLHRILIPVSDEENLRRLNAVKNLVLAEVNVEEMQFLDDDAGILVKKVKPNFKSLGPKAGGMMKELAVMVTAMSQADIAQLEKTGSFQFIIRDTPFELDIADVDILSEDIPGWQVASQGRLTVALDTTISPELKEKGLAREVINRIQNIRKEKGLEVTDRITVLIQGPEEIRRSVTNNLEYIRAEVLAARLELVDQLLGSDTITVDVDDELSILTAVNKYVNGH